MRLTHRFAYAAGPGTGRVFASPRSTAGETGRPRSNLLEEELEDPLRLHDAAVRPQKPHKATRASSWRAQLPEISAGESGRGSKPSRPMAAPNESVAFGKTRSAPRSDGGGDLVRDAALGGLDDVVVGGPHLLIGRDQPSWLGCRSSGRPDLAQPFKASRRFIPGYLATEDLAFDGYRLTVPSILSAPWPKYLSLPGPPQSWARSKRSRCASNRPLPFARAHAKAAATCGVACEVPLKDS